MSALTHIWEYLLRNRKISLLLLLAFSVPALYATASLKLNPRWTKALPREDALIEEYLQIAEDPVRGSTVYVVVDGPRPRRAALKFVTLARSLPHVRFIHGAQTDIPPNELMFLSQEQLTELTEFSKHLDLGDLITRNSGNTGDPSFALPLLEALANALEGKPHTPPVELAETVFDARLGIRSVYDEALLLRVETDISEESIEDLRPFVEALQAIQERILQEPPHTRIRMTGYPITAFDEMQRIESSSKRLTIWALLLIMILMKLFLGSLRSVFYSITVLMLSLLWVLCLTRVVFGEMNTVTMIMGLVLVGLGIDFCIHWLNHFRQGQDQGYRDIPLARFVLKKAAPPILAGAFSTAGAFLCVLLLDVPSLQEFAWLSATGVILTALLVLFVLPVLMSGKGAPQQTVSRITICTVAITEAGLRQPRKVLGTFIVLLVAGSWSLQYLTHEYNYARLQIGGLPSFQLKQEIIHRFGFSSDILVQRVKGEEASARKEQLLAHPEIKNIESICDYILPPSEQAARARIITALTDSLSRAVARRYEMKDVISIRNAIIQRRSRDSSQNLDEWARQDSRDIFAIMKRITAAITPGTLEVLNNFNRDFQLGFKQQIARRAQVKEITLQNLPTPVRAGFQTSEDGIFLQYIFPADNLWEKEPAEAMEKVLAVSAPLAVGLSRISFRLKDIILGQGLPMAVAALLVVLIALRIALKQWKMAILAAIPLICGGVLTAATLVVFGIKINFYNFIGVPIILGIGIDDGVHLVNAYRTQESPDPLLAVQETGSAILLTSLTSMIGFGCLSFYQHPGMSTLGVFLFIGVGWCLVSTLVLLPVLLQWLPLANAGISSKRSREAALHFPAISKREKYD